MQTMRQEGIGMFQEWLKSGGLGENDRSKVGEAWVDYRILVYTLSEKGSHQMVFLEQRPDKV